MSRPADRDAAASPHSVRTSLNGLDDDLARFTGRGALRRLDLGGLSMLLYPASELEGGLANLWLRVRTPSGRRAVGLLGSASTVLADDEDGPDSVVLRGRVREQDADLAWALRLELSDAAHAWRWTLQVRNLGAGEVTCDAVLAHDVALTPYDIARINEYYVSQYLDVSPVQTHDRGIAVAVRQNMPGERAPWAVLACASGGVGWASDALQLRRVADGRATLDGVADDLPSRRLQHEHTLAVLACAEHTLAPGAGHVETFIGLLVDDHPEAISDADAARVDEAFAAFGAVRPPETGVPADNGTGDDHDSDSEAVLADSLLDAPVLAVEDADEALLARVLPGRPGLVERGGDGELFAAVVDGTHVATAAKERAVLRPHGQILRTGSALTPETGVLTSTVWMAGGFASQVTQGHVSRAKLLSGRRTYLGVLRAAGLRILVDADDGWRLLDVPSAWLLRPDTARWVYATDGLLLEVEASAPTGVHELTVRLRVLEGRLHDVRVAAHLALYGDDGQQPASPATVVDGRSVRVDADAGSLTLALTRDPVRVGSDELLHRDGRPHGEPWLVLDLGAVDEGDEVGVTITADTVPVEHRVQAAIELPDPWTTVQDSLGLSAGGSALAGEVEALDALLPWVAHDAWVHYLSPRGLEQFTGGGWGTRDVSQGPVGLLTALGRPDALRALMLTLFRAQNERGDWPQAFEFLPPLPNGQGDSHGDVVFWPVLALGEYLLATGDASVLDERVAASGDDAPTGAFALREHLHRAIDFIASATRDGVLPKYGHGDWNDSLQPANPDLAHRMVSTWTATLQAHALSRLAAGLRTAGVDDDLAAHCADLSARTVEAVHDQLLADGVLSGYGLFAAEDAAADAAERPELLVHPRDQRTGMTWGVLPWIHAVLGEQLEPELAAHHLDLLREHLLGPDGARLFDRPAAYRGGPMSTFQRAEAATFWGREIGLMYTHAHLRWCEALAVHGDAGQLFTALMQANPIGLVERVPASRPRQTSCYYSSSDAVFTDRYEAAERYPEVMRGDVDLEGGWRVYSSGPGLYLRLVVESLLGVRVRAGHVELDPVLDPRLDGLDARVPLDGGVLRLHFRVSGAGSGVRSVRAGDRDLATEPLANRYRAPGVRVAASDLHDAVARGEVVTVEVG